MVALKLDHLPLDLSKPPLTALAADQCLARPQAVGSLSKVSLIHFTLQRECLNGHRGLGVVSQ